MRTINEAAIEIRNSDPQTALTKHALRQMVINGNLKSVKVGNKYLIAMETLEHYLTSTEGQ